MCSFSTISDIPPIKFPEEFVQELIKMKANIGIYDFMLELKARFYPNVNMILYEDFSQYVGKDDEFCIDARMYYKYSKLFVPGYKFDLNTCDPRSRIIKVLDNSEMEKDINYKLLIEREVRSQSEISNTDRYMMNPESFYLLLMDIPDRYHQARQAFCKYHAFQTKVIKYYNNFQIGLTKLIDDENQKILAIKDEKIQSLEIAMDEQSKELNQKTRKKVSEIQELLSCAKNTLYMLKEAYSDIQSQIIKIDDLTDMVKKLNEKLEKSHKVDIECSKDYAMIPKSVSKREYFSYLESPEYGNILYAIRSRKSNIPKNLKDPNSIKMFNRFKDRVHKITIEWKCELRSQRRSREITHNEYDNKMNYMLRFPLIRINRNSIDFDESRISTDEIIKLMKDTTFERLPLRIP